jgi:hypothetical protein
VSTNADFGWVPTVQEISNADLVQIMHWMSTVSCGHMVLCDMCCLGGCRGSCAWSNACMWSWLREGCSPKWCMVALEKWIQSFTAFEAPYITQAMTLLICASHCVHLPSRPALNCQNVSSYHSTYKRFVTRIQTACNDRTKGL